MKQINVMIKPASSACNMRCAYCFYADESRIRQVPSYGLMSRDTARCILEKFASCGAEHWSFAFQGGEPTLAGLGFFEDFAAMERQLGYTAGNTAHAIQTNGLTADADWASLWKRENYLVGLSLDGSHDVHDYFRRDAAGKGSYSRVLQTARLLEKAQVPFNILTVVTPSAARHIQSIFNGYKKLGFKYQQYITCLDPLEGEAEGFVPDEKTLAQFLKQLFDLWFRELQAGNYISVRFFDNLVYMLRGEQPELCSMSGHCNVQYLIEADGSVYPCDFYALDEYRLGNILADSIEDIDRRRIDTGFIQQSMQPPEECRRCRYAPLCRNGCRRERSGGPSGRNIHCEAYKEFYEYALPRLRAVAAAQGR